MSTVDPGMVSEYAQRDGFNAARALQPIQSVEEYLGTHPEVMNGDDSDRSLYRTTFRSRYNQTISEMGAAGLKYDGKSPAQVAEENAAKEASKKTVSEWEQESSIPSWSIAKAVAANFNADVDAFQSRVRASVEVTKTSEGTLWAAKYATFYAQWKSVYTAIQAQSGYSPSSAVAEVRKARSSLVALSKAFDGLSRSGAVVAPPPAPPAPPVPPPVGAKSILPTVGIIAAIAAAAGGAWWMFSSKSAPKKPELLGGRP